MTGKTHRVGGVVACLGGYMILHQQGMLLTDVNPVLQLAVMYPFAIYGSTVSDLDHHWQSAPSKDVLSRFINFLLHPIPNSDNTLLNAKHRSWQTHSDLFLFVMFIVGLVLFNTMPTTADQVLIYLIFTGLVLGIISHLVLDMLTPQGIWCLPLMGIKKIFNLRNFKPKLTLVPNSSFFATDGKWENGVRIFLWLSSFLLLALVVLTFFPNLTI